MNDLEKMLGEFFDTADEAELSALGVFPDERLDLAASTRILSSAERKAGINMNDTKDNITIKKTAKHSRRFIGAVIAAAVLATGAVGAGASYAYAQFTNRQGVESYMGEQAANELESMGLAVNEVRENDHVRITLDTVLSDGDFAQLIFTLEKLDDEARSLVKRYPVTYVHYADTGEMCTPLCAMSYMLWAGNTKFDADEQIYYPEGDVLSFEVDLGPYQAELSRGVKLTFQHPLLEKDAEYLFDGIEFTPDLSKNAGSVTMKAEYGGEVRLLPFGLTGQHIELPKNDLSYDFNHHCWNLIRKDGTREPLSEHGTNGYCAGTLPDLYFSLNAETFFDIDDYIGIEIEGVEYYIE